MSAFEKVFRIKQSGSTTRREIAAGLVTFMTMAYIIFVNPAILSDEAGANMDFGAVMLATCAASAFATLVMGLVARYPIALAPGMGLNAFFSYNICAHMGVPWRIALGVVFISGVIFTALTVVRVRKLIFQSIPRSLKFSIAAGIGVFIAFIGLKNAGIVVAHPKTLLAIGDLHALPALVALAGTGVIAVLMAARVRGSILIGIVAAGVIAVLTDLIGVSEKISGLSGIFGLPQIETPTFLELDIAGIFSNIHIFFAPVLILLFFDMFDTIGTLVGVSEQAGFLDKDGNLPRANRALLADSVGTMAGAVAGTSTVTSYIESAAGVSEGGRTGFASVVTALLFVAAIFFYPVVELLGVCGAVTAPALIMVGVLMMRNIAKIKWDEITDAIPAFLTVVLMPLTFSIAHGLAIGFISYPIVKTLGGRAREVHWLVYVLGALFLLRYIFLPT